MATKPRTVFRIPTQQEVADWIYNAMGVHHPKDQTAWPRRFCEYMAEKFWNRYQATGWQYGGRMMKDWGAAFHAQWKHLKYKEDRDMLEKCLSEPAHRMYVAQQRKQADGMFAEQYGTATVGSEKPIIYWLEFYHKLMESWRSGQVTNKQLRDHYHRLDKMGLLKFSPAQIDWIAAQSGNDGDYRRGLCVEVLFTVIGRKRLTLMQYYDKVHQHAIESK